MKRESTVGTSALVAASPPSAAGASNAVRPRATDTLALMVLLTGAFLSPLDYFIVNLALPAIRTGLHASTAQLQLVVSVYTSAFAVLLVTGGRLGDSLGRKRLFMAGMAGFIAASLGCALATSGSALVVARLLQGAGAAMLVPQILATIRSAFAPERQAKVMGLYGFVYGFASVAGQIGGGALITLHPFGLGWRAIFLINVPVGVLALVGAWRFMPESRASRVERVDVQSLLMLTSCFALVIYPLTQGREAGWPAWTSLCFTASLPVLAAFLFRQQRVKRGGGAPLIDLSLFRNPVFSIGLVLAFCFYCDSAFFLTYGIDLQSGLGWSPLSAGLAIVPFGAGSILGPLVSPALVRRLHHHVLTTGFAALAVGFAATCAASRSVVPDTFFYLGLALAGMGHGIVLPSVVRIVIGEIEPAKAGLASSVVTTMLQVGSAFGATAISGVFFSIVRCDRSAAAYAQAYRQGMAVLAVMFFVCVALSFVLAAAARARRLLPG